MAFVRLGEDGSDVWVYARRFAGFEASDVDLIECVGCEVEGDRAAIVAHLHEHRERGDTVPQRVIDDLDGGVIW